MTLKEKITKGEVIENLTLNEDLILHHFANDFCIDFKIIIRNSNFKSIKGECIEFYEKIEFDNCKFESISFNGIVINKGFLLKNCEVSSFVDLSCSRFEPSEENFKFENNKFKNVVTFEDCDFKSAVKIIDNDFEKGTDLNTIKQLGCYYPKENSIIENNKGNLELTETEEEKLWKEIRNKK